jgi:predicted glycogen debranching enzyme
LIVFSNYPGRDLDEALGKEWLETNGIGGYASSTIVGLNTRRYHGLLTAATHPPLGRLVLLSKLEETLIDGAARIEFGCNEYPDAIHPRGNDYLEDFRLDPFPVFTYRAGTMGIRKTVFAVQGENTTVIAYEASERCALELRPLVAFRDYHSLTRRNDVLDRRVDMQTQSVSIAPYADLPRLHFAHTGATVAITGDWYYRFRYRIEQERGLDYEEDLFQPFSLRFELQADEPVAVIVSTEVRDAKNAEFLRVSEVQRRAQLKGSVAAASEFAPTLAVAADQFIVNRGKWQTALAGYHWFSDWGRDTMVALPGLTLATGRTQTAKNILVAFAGAVSQGMLPNRWPDAGNVPEYNTADATLWFIEAVGALMRATRDYDFLRAKLIGILHDILAWHLRGTRFGIRAQENGLLACGEEGSQLTWMDARVNGVPVTPRKGMPVEIQALWYNALRTMEHLCAQLGDGANASRYEALATSAYSSFQPLFWNPAHSCLYDSVDGDFRDGSVRPNQIFAVSLTHPLLDGERSRQVVDCVERELLTPFGLRTLTRCDPRYIGVYVGGPSVRDAAYHQGTVWSWLLGPFITAYLRVHKYSAAAVDCAQRWLVPIQNHLLAAGLGQISEIFDGDPPHHPRGCIAQAWSVGEILRILCDLSAREHSKA